MAKSTDQAWSKPSRLKVEAVKDKWVGDETAVTPLPAVKPARTKRLTLDLEEDLHRRIKVACSARGSTMVVEITKLLKKEFPAE